MAGTHFTLVRNTDFLPPGAIQLGIQTDGAKLYWTAVAHTKQGDIPGKANLTENSCSYGYHGKEHTTECFSWVVHHHPKPLQLVKNDGSGVPCNALKVGNQTDGSGDMYAAIAISEWGTVPGKAQHKTCCFPYGGSEHPTEKFYWVCHQ